MLQQLVCSPQSVHAAAADLVPLEPRAHAGDASSVSSDGVEDSELPQCKIRRNYNCLKCTFFTQNPRVYLVHVRDVHFERFKIYDCPQCVYASRHQQKLLRHIKMVHASSKNDASCKVDADQSTAVNDGEEGLENIEDMVEEVEEIDYNDVEMSDDRDESFDQSMGTDCDSTIQDETLQNDGDKSKMFSCKKCNYVTHLKSRFTKHVKYHSMPMIKCTLCDFRTPYKWNLDRHMKNHGGTGVFCCSMCNFTADIKQSLTVHEMNHHASSAGQSPANRRRNRVGASDVFVDKSVGLMTKEEEGSGDSRSSHSMPDFGSQYSDMMEMENNDSTDTEKMESTKKEISMVVEESQISNQSDDYKTQNKKKARPMPQLIPLNSSTPSKSTTGEPPQKKMKHMLNTETIIKERLESAPDISLIPIQSNAFLNNLPKKKNESFFDKLKERLLSETGKEGSLTCKNCGFESKCLSEQSVHEKNCSSNGNRVVLNTLLSNPGSTRCQNCRHRCKSSADLYVHMQTCSKNKTAKTEDQGVERKMVRSNDTGTSSSDTGPHPMENVVFVWNNINQDTNKFNTPLDISINEDSTLPSDMQRNYDPNNVDALHDNEGMNLSPTQTVGKKVYKCPHCPFWASTASRFHVHIVGHLNKKPFECSFCKYKSNWRWDITKHIKLKSARDPDHNNAEVLMTDETGRRNYSKYNKFLALVTLNEDGENDFQYIDQGLESPNVSIDTDEPAPENGINNDNNVNSFMQPLDLQKYMSDFSSDDAKKQKKTLWKCKKCNYRDPSREALLEHVREHSKVDDNSDELRQVIKKAEASKDPNDLAYRCGHCSQLSNWKHVIQRHCRLKHDGVIKVIATEKPKVDQLNAPDISDYCQKCPFKTNDKKEFMAHMQQHSPSPQSIFKCYFCYYFVKTEHELLQHLSLHGISDPEDYVAKAMGCKDPIPEQIISTKRHKCTDCPYETNSKSQYMYHEQFHRLPADTPYKCQECNYSVSKRHLLHQHMKVHGIIINKKDLESENEIPYKNEPKPEVVLEDIPYVWVAAKNEFHKMFKCRYCSYVNAQKCKIPNHEKIHCLLFENSEIKIYKCLECKFTCDSASPLAEHSKSHSEIYGKIYFAVETNVSDEEQIVKLREIIEEEKQLAIEALNNKEDLSKGNDEEKILHFCQKCPTRFFSENELKLHEKFHDLIFTNKCKLCEFSVPQENQLSTHMFVHTDEYQSKTKMLKIVHDTHQNYKEPVLELIHSPNTSEITWIVPNKHKNSGSKRNNETKQGPKQYFCKLCPAKFFKNAALSYHVALHGGEGDYRCKSCNYTVKNVGNLAKHELLHENKIKTTNCDYESGDDIDFKNIPLSGTDLFHRKTEAQKRVLIDKDKLVKPNDHFPPVLQADPQFGYLMHGNPEFIYPTYLKNGRQKEKRYKCHKCPSAFEKREQYKIHLSLHGSKQRYKCELCDYSVKYYANYVQHMRKHQMNDEAKAERKKGTETTESEHQENNQKETHIDNIKFATKTIPRSLPKSDFQQYSITDQQTLRLLQRRRSLNSAIADISTDNAPQKERKLYLCVLCPYNNQRQDSLLNHYRRHKYEDSDYVLSNCPHCDLTIQGHFVKDHIKSHFNYLNTNQPQCFAANNDVTFTITRTVDDTPSTTDLCLLEAKDNKCNTEDTMDHIFVSDYRSQLL